MALATPWNASFYRERQAIAIKSTAHKQKLTIQIFYPYSKVAGTNMMLWMQCSPSQEEYHLTFPDAAAFVAAGDT